MRSVRISLFTQRNQSKFKLFFKTFVKTVRSVEFKGNYNYVLKSIAGWHGSKHLFKSWDLIESQTFSFV